MAASLAWNVTMPALTGAPLYLTEPVTFTGVWELLAQPNEIPNIKGRTRSSRTLVMAAILSRWRSKETNDPRGVAPAAPQGASPAPRSRWEARPRRRRSKKHVPPGAARYQSFPRTKRSFGTSARARVGLEILGLTILTLPST